MSEEQFPPGTPVCVRQIIERQGRSYETEVVGVVESWATESTGSWYAHGKDDKLWLHRLKLRKADGELTLVVIDDDTEIAKIEAAR